MNGFKGSRLTVALGCAFLALAWSSSGVARDANADVKQLETVRVVGEEGAGVVRLNAADIALQPAANPSVTDLFRGLSTIQFDAGSRASGNQADIASPLISIAGATPAESTYLLDGLNNNNRFNPTGYGRGDVNYMTPPVANPESLMVSTQLLESVEVYETDIPVNFGSFAGGVVNAKLRNPRSDRWHGSVEASYTNQDLTHQIWAPEDDPSKLGKTNSQLSRDFMRAHAGLTLEGPLGSSSLSALIGVTHDFSSYETMATTTEGLKTNHRSNDNVLLRVTAKPNDRWVGSTTLIYAPYQGQYYGDKLKNGEWKNKGGGVKALVNVEGQTEWGVLTVDAQYSQSHVERDTKGNNKLYKWLNDRASTYANWAPSSEEYAWEGLFGDMTYEDKGWSFKPVFAFKPFGDKVTHKVVLGLEANFDSFETYSQENVAYGNPTQAMVMEGDIADGVIPMEQYLMSKMVNWEDRKSRDDWNAALFLSDTMKWDRFTVRPGVRVARDSLLKETTVSPRLFVDADLFNDDRYHVHGGLARYWASAGVTQNLGLGFDSTTYMREFDEYSYELGDWYELNTWKMPADPWEGLKTPYTDEVTVGGSAVLPQGFGKVRTQYTFRDYRDQFAARTAPFGTNRTVYYTNDGRSRYQGLTLNWEKTVDGGDWGQHAMRFGATWSKSTGNNPNRFTTGGDKLDALFVLLDGKVTPVTDLPASSFNSPWVLTYDHNARFFDDRLKAHLSVRWQSASTKLVDLEKKELVDGQRYPVYKTLHRNHWFNADLGLEGVVFKRGDAEAAVTLDVLNVFDNKNIINEGTGSGVRYGTGTQFILGVKARF